jgi:fatty-acyl-CoA synthase
LLYVVDRKKDVIVTGGENVASREIEDVLHSHPAVREVAVIGVPDPHWGENVCALVVPQPSGSDPASDLVELARSRLAGFKAPRHVVLVDSLPKNASGKVLKADLRRWLADHPELLGERG